MDRKSCATPCKLLVWFDFHAKNQLFGAKYRPPMTSNELPGSSVFLALTNLEQFGIVLAEQLLEGGGGTVLQGVDSLDQAEDVRRHNQQVPNTSGTRIPKGVRRTAGDDHGGTSGSFNFVFTGLHAQSSFQNVPGFVVAVVDMAWGNQAWRPRRAAGILPLGDDERIVW